MADQRKENFYLLINDIFEVNSLKATPKPSVQQVEKAPPAQSSTSTLSPISLPVNDPSLLQPVAMPSNSAGESTYEPTYNATLYLLEENSATVRSIYVLNFKVIMFICVFWL